MSDVREHLEPEMLNWLDAMRAAFGGGVKLKHVVTPTIEAGSEACLQDGPESQADLARRIASEAREE